MTIKIRLASLSDLNGLCKVEAESFDTTKYHTSSRRQFRHLLTKGQADILVAVNGDDVVGSAVIFYRSTSRFGRFYSLAVRPDFQGGSIGKDLFAAVEKRIKDKGLSGILLEIRGDNAKLLERYIALGYVRTGSLPAYYADGCDGIKMRKTFSGTQ